jgi:redox-sensing transcriptional repressor
LTAALRQPARLASEPTLRRLPLYLRLLKQLHEEGRVSIACTDIGAHLGFDPTQVRKDIEVTGLPGKPKVGYQLTSLVEAIEEYLGFTSVSEAFLVGAGSMGAALLGYRKFEEYGLHIVAAFDDDSRKWHRQIHGKVVLPLDKLPELARRMHVLIGVITVPAEAAQDVAQIMVDSGIRAIWNFAPVRLRVPPEVIVRNEDLYCSLASLSQRLAIALRAEQAADEPHPVSQR